MCAAWARPSLTVLEVCWRWTVGFVVIAMAYVAFGDFGVEWGIDTTALHNATVFQPAAAIAALAGVARSVWPHVVPGLKWLLPAACTLWLLCAAFGRTFLLRRLDPSLRPQKWAIFWLGAVRMVLLGAFWCGWAELLAWATRTAITGPAANHVEPDLVIFSAIVICGTLFLYVLWGIVSWPFQLAPLLAMLQDKGPIGSLGAAFRAGPVRGKLIEINLVMHIVKLALIVLAMVFSASPLPFSTVTTATFLACWWSGVMLLYFAASDYFHVVRSAAYLALWKTYEIPSKA
jgi:hypothetical protein